MLGWVYVLNLPQAAIRLNSFPGLSDKLRLAGSFLITFINLCGEILFIHLLYCKREGSFRLVELAGIYCNDLLKDTSTTLSY